MALKVTRPPESRKQWRLAPQLPRQHSCSSQRGESYPRTMTNESAVSCSLPPFPPHLTTQQLVLPGSLQFHMRAPHGGHRHQNAERGCPSRF